MRPCTTAGPTELEVRLGGTVLTARSYPIVVRDCTCMRVVCRAPQEASVTDRSLPRSGPWPLRRILNSGRAPTPPRPNACCPCWGCATSCPTSVSYTHLRAHETRHDLVCRLLLEKQKI